jgi:hypothetical protein
MPFYRPGGSNKAINRQYDMVYADYIGATTGWLPVHKGDTIAVNVCRALLNFVTAASSTVTKSPVFPEVDILMEMRMFGSEQQGEEWPVDVWQNVLVATSRRAHRDGWVRLRITNVNNADGTGVAMALQVSRTGDSGAVT